MNDDELEGKARKAVGAVQEGAGRLVGDEELEGRGVFNQAVGTLQDGYGRVRGAVKDLVEDAPGAARDAYATGRDYARRGAVTVTRVASDNTALTALVAGVAVAAVGWLVLGRRRRKEGRED
jgi:uncharacterized protein YjbJ (UPF0337 family)